MKCLSFRLAVIAIALCAVFTACGSDKQETEAVEATVSKTAETSEQTTQKAEPVIQTTRASYTTTASRDSEIQDIDVSWLVPGFSKSLVLKNCGISNYEKADDNSYTGMTSFAGIPSVLKVNFNDDDELSGYCIATPMTYSNFLNVFLPTFEDNYGSAYEEDGTYYWLSSDSTLIHSLEYRNSVESAIYTVLFVEYTD